MRKISTLLSLVALSCGMAQAQTESVISKAVAFYDFEGETIVNQYDETEVGTPSYTTGTTSLEDAEAPTLVTDETRSSQVLHTNFGYADVGISYLAMPNPLYGETLEDGFSVSLWLNNVSGNLWDTMFSFYNNDEAGRFYVTGGGYIGYNDWAGNWIDIDYPTITTGNISANTWTYVTLTVSRTEGPKLYVDGSLKDFQAVNSSVSDLTVATITDFSFDGAVTFVAGLTNMYLGYGSFWGSLDAYYDNVAVFSSVLTADEVSELYASETSAGSATGIAKIAEATATDGAAYNLAGQRVNGSAKGIVVKNGKKYISK